METKVINFYGGPGIGKSTTAAGLYARLKQKGKEVELVREYAKDAVWEGRLNMLEDQFYIFAKQRKRIRDLDTKVEFIVTDAPILMSLVYGFTEPPAFHELVRHEYRQRANLDILLTRAKEYKQAGRVQTQGQAEILDVLIESTLVGENPRDYWRISGDDWAVESIMHKLSFAGVL